MWVLADKLWKTKTPAEETRSTIKQTTSSSNLEQAWDVLWKINPIVWLANKAKDIGSDIPWTLEKVKDFWQWAFEKTKDIASWWIERIQEAWEWITSWKYDIDEWLMRWAAWALQTATSPIWWVVWQWAEEVINKIPQWFKDFIAEKAEPTIEDAKIWYNSQPTDVQKNLKNLWVWVEVLSYFIWVNAAKNVWKNVAKTWVELKDELVKWVKDSIKTIEEVPWKVWTKIEQWLISSSDKKAQLKATLTDDITWNIIQWKPKDIKPAIETFKQIDTEWVQTYSDLWWKVKQKLNDIIKTQDEYLDQYKNPLNKDLATKEVKTSKWIIKNNPIDNAFNDIDNVITQTWEDLYSAPVWNRTLWEVIDNINNWNWTLKDYNDLARFYNSEFKSKIYTKTWEAKDAIQASKYEETRTGIKKFVRDNLWDDTLKQLDRDYANVAKTNELIQKAVEKIQTLQQKTREPWILWKVWAMVWTGVDVMTWWLLRWVLWRILPRWFDTNRVDWIWIQKELRKNLNTLDKALWKQKTNPTKVSTVLWKIAWVKDKSVTLKPKPIVIKKSDVKPERLALPQWKIITPQTIKKWKTLERSQEKKWIKIKEKAIIEESKKDIKNAKIWNTKPIINKTKQSVTPEQSQNASKQKSNKTIINKKETTTEWKKESSSDRVSRLIQEAKDRDDKNNIKVYFWWKEWWITWISKSKWIIDVSLDKWYSEQYKIKHWIKNKSKWQLYEWTLNENSNDIFNISKISKIKNKDFKEMLIQITDNWKKEIDWKFIWVNEKLWQKIKEWFKKEWFKAFKKQEREWISSYSILDESLLKKINLK